MVARSNNLGHENDRSWPMLSKKAVRFGSLTVFLRPDRGIWLAVYDGVRLDRAAADADAVDTPHAGAGWGGGPISRSAMVLRFCTMAARWNSSRAPERPLSRMRSKP